MLLCRPQSASDEIQFRFRGRDTLFGLLLEGMQDIDGGLEPDGVHSPIGIPFLS